MTQIKLEVVNEDEDESQYDDPAWEELARAFSWHDHEPRRGFCKPPFLAESHHREPHPDVRDDNTFGPYYIILARPFYGGGVYTNIDSMRFAMQGYDQKPDWKVRETWKECVDSWQLACRLGLHEHALPDDSDLPPLPMSSLRAQSPRDHDVPSSTTSGPCSGRPASTASAVSTPAPPKRTSAPSTPRTGRSGSSAARATSATPVLRSARAPLVRAPVTPTRTPRGPSSRTPGPSVVRASQTPGPTSRSPAKLLFASRGSTPSSGVLTQDPAKLEEMLDAGDNVFMSGSETAVADYTSCADPYPQDACALDFVSFTCYFGPETKMRSSLLLLRPLYFAPLPNGLTKTSQTVDPHSRLLEGKRTNSYQQGERAQIMQSVYWYAASPHPSLFRIPSIDMTKPRKKAADDPSRNRRGPTPWCTGNKAAFIHRRFPTWLSLNRKGRSAYVDSTLIAFVLAFGMFFDLKKDLDHLPDEPEPGTKAIELDDDDEDNRALAEAYLKGLRTKISVAFREERDRKTAAAKNVDINALWNEHIHAQAQKRPSGVLRLMHFYSVYHYDDHIKSAFESEWVEVWRVWEEKCADWDTKGVPIPDDEKEPQAVAVRTRVTQECWDREPVPFKVLVQEAHEKYKEEKRASRGVPIDVPEELRTPQDFQDAIDAASVYLPPTTDAVGGKMGFICTVLCAGPMPSEGGEIGMLSVHYGTTLGDGLKWYQADRVGFGTVERQYIDFAKLCYCATSPARQPLTRLRRGRRLQSPASSRAPSPASPRALSPTSPRALSPTSSRAPSPTSSRAPSPTSPRALSPTSSRRHSPRAISPTPLATPPSSPRIPPTPHSTPYVGASPPLRSAMPSFDALTGLLSQITNTTGETALGEKQQLPPQRPDVPAARHVDLVDDDADIESGRSHDVWSYQSSDRWSLHVRDLYSALHRGRGWGLSFATLICTWLKLEDHLDYPIRDDGRRVIAGSIRPPAYTAWTRQGCPYDLPVDVGDLATFARQYWLWWEALQPSRRLNSDNSLIAIEEFEGMVKGMDDWDGLDKCCGKEGLVQVLLLLLWWGDAVNGAVARPAEWLEWETAVQDFRDILSLMMRTPGFDRVARKRSRGRPAADQADGENGGADGLKSTKGSRKRKGEGAVNKAPKRAKTKIPAEKGSSKGARKRKADEPVTSEKPSKRAKVTETAPSSASAGATKSGASSTMVSTPSAESDVGSRQLRDRTTLVKTFKVRALAP
ncbi:hypothetical protein K523DRAFT_301143 [Schizophyllum commune Tattone D]|nr:hypothetical protein K523DRAFT_301143 [Schizophyllum commune Tattone D]